MQREADSNAAFDGHVEGDPWLTLQQGADRAQVHEATMRGEIRRGRLRASRLGGRQRIRLRQSWIDEWLEATAPPVAVRRPSPDEV